jgi:hypothetical protein
MESTFKKKIDIVDHGNGSTDIKYKSFRFGMGVRVVLLLVMAVLGLLLAGLLASGKTSLAVLVIVGEAILFKLAYKTTHTITVTNEGVLWAGGRKRLAFKDINESFTTQNLFGYGNSHGVQFSAQGTTVVIASDLEDKATASAIVDLIIKKMNSNK